MIRLDHVSKSYDGGRTFVVRDLCLDVAAGELLVLLGESGCGKTTTLKMINRLIERSSGTIYVDGRDTSGADVVALRRGIGYVFQMIGLFPHMTVGENVAMVPGLLGWPRRRTEERVDELLAMVGLPPPAYRDRYPRELSGGQRQRVGFARALAAGPPVMLLDEPFGALDPITRDGLQREVKRLHAALGFTAVMVTHDVTESLLLGTRVAVMRGGRIARIGTPGELLGDPGDPYVAELMEAPRRQAAVFAELAAGEGTTPWAQAASA